MRMLVRLTVRQHRFEVIALCALLALTALGLAAVGAVWSTLPVAECLLTSGPRCQALMDTLQVINAIGAPVLAVAVAGPAAAGVILGAGLVSKEVDRGTAVLPWTMGRSRRRWLLERMLVFAAIVGGLALILAVLTDSLVSMFDLTPLDSSLFGYEVRGWMIPARAMVGLAAGVLAGAMLGRPIPGLLAGAVIAVVCCTAVLTVGDGLNRAQAVEFVGRGGLYLDSILRDRTGAIVTWDEANARLPQDDPNWVELFNAEFTSYDVGVPGSESRVVTGREVLMLGGLAALMTAAAVVVVERRRPY